MVSTMKIQKILSKYFQEQNYILKVNYVESVTSITD